MQFSICSLKILEIKSQNLFQHPGGVELLEEYAGQDATRGFDEFGHSSDAKRMLKQFLVGELVEVTHN